MSEVARREETVSFPGATILFRNFAGAQKQFNEEGKRNFHVLLDPEVAEQMLADGWNVKYLKPREEGDTPQAHLQVAVNFKGPRPPKIVLVGTKNKTTLDEELAVMADWAEIDHVDLIIRAYNWDVQGNTGKKAYLKSIYIYILEDEFEAAIADLPELGAGPQRDAIEASVLDLGELQSWQAPGEIES